MNALTDDAFKKDGEIRADALSDLIAHVGFDVTAADVAAIKAKTATGA